MSRTLLLLYLCITVDAQTPEMVQLADSWAVHFGIEKELVHAVIEAESAWNPNAVSAVGAAGLMQLMPATAATFGVSNRFDAAENIRGGVAYLAWLRDECDGDLRLIIASYNAGFARVRRLGLKFQSVAVRSYVERVAFLYRRNRWISLLRLSQPPQQEHR
jgi:soluble lytic murein transglycosylase-like protein